MGEVEAVRVEERPTRPLALPLVPIGIAVDRVAKHRAVEVFEVDADLVRAAGTDAHGDEAEAIAARERMHHAQRLTASAARRDGHLHTINWMPANGLLHDRDWLLSWSAGRDGEIDLTHLALLKGA